MIAGLVLAAGASNRLGRPKQLLDLGGRPLLQWPVAALRAYGAGQLVVVLGHEAARIRALVDLHDVDIVVNPAYADGMSTSLRAGLTVLHAQIDAVLVLTGDQPLVTGTHLRALVQEGARTAMPLIATDYGDYSGVPMLLAREAWAWADAVTGDQGARALLRLYPDRVGHVHSASAHMNLDIDTPDQYEQVLNVVSTGEPGNQHHA